MNLQKLSKILIIGGLIALVLGYFILKKQHETEIEDLETIDQDEDEDEDEDEETEPETEPEPKKEPLKPVNNGNETTDKK